MIWIEDSLTSLPVREAFERRRRSRYSSICNSFLMRSPTSCLNHTWHVDFEPGLQNCNAAHAFRLLSASGFSTQAAFYGSADTHSQHAQSFRLPSSPL